MRRENRQWKLISPDKSETKTDQGDHSSLTAKFSMVEALLDMVQNKLDERLGNLERKARHRQFKIEAMISQSQCMMKDAEELLEVKKAAKDAKSMAEAARVERTKKLAAKSVERFEVKKEQRTEFKNRSTSRETDLNLKTTKDANNGLSKISPTRKVTKARPAGGRTPVNQQLELSKNSPNKSYSPKITKPRIDYGRANKSKTRAQVPLAMEADIEPVATLMPLGNNFTCSKCQSTSIKQDKMNRLVKELNEKKAQMEKLMADVSSLTDALVSLQENDCQIVDEKAYQSQNHVLQAMNTNSDLQSSAKPRYLSPSPVKSVKIYEGYEAKTLKGGRPQASDDSFLRQDIRRMIRSQADKLTKENNSPIN